MTNLEKFITSANEKHNNKYDYSLFNYTGNKSESLIICPIHGSFSQSPRNHLRNPIACPLCKEEYDKNKRAQEFINKAKERFGDKFDYSKFVYIDAKTKSTIICCKHGEFNQTPDKHLQSINACPMCEQEAKIIRSKNKSLETLEKMSQGKKKDSSYFLAKATQKFGNSFDYDLTNYNGMTGNPIKIHCHIHGWFEKVPHTFLVSNYGCTECGMEYKNNSKTKSYKDFVAEASSIHKGKYTYPESNSVIYKNRKSIINIECPKHGIFTKKAQKHLSGQGCFKCKIEELIKNGVLVGGYNSDLFSKDKNIANKKGYIYYLQINNGEYYKVGITLNIQKRLSTLSSKFDKVDLLYQKEGRLEDMYEKEQAILQLFQIYRVYHKESTELFMYDISKEKDFEIFYK